MRSLLFVYCRNCSHNVTLHELEDFAVIGGDEPAWRWTCRGPRKNEKTGELSVCTCKNLAIRDDGPKQES